MDLSEKFEKFDIAKGNGIEQGTTDLLHKDDGQDDRSKKGGNDADATPEDKVQVDDNDESSEEDDWEDSVPISAPKQIDFDESNSLEIWNFPSYYTKKELEALFGLRIEVKWIDDTSAIIHFETPQDLKKSYLQLSGHPTIKHKIYTPMEKRDRTARPTTTDMVARRMIAGALGMQSKLKKSATEIESDSLKLRMVREEKENAIKKKADEKEQRLKASNDLFDS